MSLLPTNLSLLPGTGVLGGIGVEKGVFLFGLRDVNKIVKK